MRSDSLAVPAPIAEASTVGSVGPETGEAAARDRATAAVFAGIVAATMTLYYYNSNVGVAETAGRESVQAASIAFFLIFFGHGWRVLLDRIGVRPRPWLQSDGTLSLAALAILCFCGLATPFLPASPLPLLGLLGLLSGVSASMRAFRPPVKPAATLLFLVLAFFFAARMSWFVLTGLEWTLANAGADRDLPYHAAIASMIQTYGVVATGVDGLVYQPYHFGSHWVAAQLANLTGSTLFTFYQSTFRTVTIAFFLHALLGFVITLREWVYVSENRMAQALRSDPLFWVLLYLGIIGIHRGLAVRVMDDYHGSVLGSESFVLAQACAYCAFSLFVTFFRERVLPFAPAAGRRAPPAPLDTADRVFLCALLPVLLAVLGLTKISLMAVALPVVGWVFLRYRLFRRPVFCLALACATALAGLAFWKTRVWVSNPPELTGETVMAFVRRYLTEPWQTSAAVLAYAFWPALFVFSRFRQLRLATFADVFAALRARRLVDVELVLLVCLIGFGPTMVSRIAGGGEIYFTIVPIIASLALFLGCRGLAFQAAAAVARAWRRRAAPRVEWAVVLLAAAPFLVLVADEAYNPTGASMDVMNGIIKHIVVVPFKCLTTDVSGNRAREQKRLRAAKPAAYNTLRLLNRLHRLPRAEKRRSLLFVPKTTRAYWKALNPIHYRSQPCMVRPFVAPAIAGLAMLDGRPEPGCIGVEAPAYNLTWRAPVLDTSDAAVCAAASERGFYHVYVMEDARENGVAVREVSCGTS